jgi:hypothetical protein
MDFLKCEIARIERDLNAHPYGMERAMGIEPTSEHLEKNSVQVRYHSGGQKQEVVPVSDTRERAYGFCSFGS